MGIVAAIDLVIALLARASAISALVAKAQGENRPLSEDEWDSIVEEDDEARSELVEAIAKARDEGR